MAMHMVAVSHNWLDNSNHAVANNTIYLRKNAVQMLLTSYTVLVEFTVASHVIHKKHFYECMYDPPTGQI